MNSLTVMHLFIGLLITVDCKKIVVILEVKYNVRNRLLIYKSQNLGCFKIVSVTGRLALNVYTFNMTFALT